MASAPPAIICSTAVSPAASAMSATTTWAPFLAKAAAVARPIPYPAPVTIATVPSNSIPASTRLPAAYRPIDHQGGFVAKRTRFQGELEPVEVHAELEVVAAGT